MLDIINYLVWCLVIGLPLSIIFLMIHKYIKLIRLSVPVQAKNIVLNGTAHSSQHNLAIPQVIWSYWHQGTPPDFVSRCVNNWSATAPGYQIRFLNKETIGEWVAQQLPNNFDDLPPYRQADWLRLELLKTYGGIWIDSSIILTQPLDWIHQSQQINNAEYVGFYIEQFTAQQTSPIIENWFMAAAPNSQFINDLAQEFNYAIAQGEDTYLEELQNKGLFEAAVQLISPPKLHKYLIMHVAASVILNRAPNQYRLALLKAEDSAFAFHILVKWSKKTLHAKLALTPCPKTLPVLIKLRGGERNKCDELIKKGLFLKGSLLQRFLNL